MKFGQAHAQRAILEHGQHAIACVLVERHAAFEWAAVIAHHARSEHRVGFARHQRMIHLRENFRRVLPIAMQQHDDIETLIDEMLIAGLLISAVAQVLLVLQHLKFRQRLERLQPHREFIRRVLAGIVEHRNFGDVLPHIRRNSLQHFL